MDTGDVAVTVPLVNRQYTALAKSVCRFGLVSVRRRTAQPHSASNQTLSIRKVRQKAF